MSHLVLELRPGELMVVNGATIRFRNKCRVELVSHARFLFGKQIMAAHEAATAMRLLYYRLQTAYVGPLEERAEAASEVRALIARLQVESPTEVAVLLGSIKDAFDAEDFYKALKLLRVMIQDDRSLDSPDHDTDDAGA